MVSLFELTSAVICCSNEFVVSSDSVECCWFVGGWVASFKEPLAVSVG